MSSDWGAADAAENRVNNTETHPKDVGRKPSVVFLSATDDVDPRDQYFDHVEVNDGYVFCRTESSRTIYPMHRVNRIERVSE